jgi:hypothetical protein
LYIHPVKGRFPLHIPPNVILCTFETWACRSQPVPKLIIDLTVATTWFFNFVLSITWPSLKNAFTISGAFYWYAAWNIVGWWLVLLFVPETKALTLEELDQVFSVPTHKHATYQLGQAKRWFRKYILRQNVGPKEELYKHAEKKTQEA